MKKITIRLSALLLTAVMLLSCIPAAGALNNWNMEYFLKKYSDPHFNLENEPNRVMTVEEFIGIIYAYSYYGDGNAAVTCRDKNGRAPSAWCAPYIQAEVNKGVVTPGDVSWTDPVTVAFAAQYLCRSKGKYSYDSANLYSFTGTQGLGADDILYLSVAVDHGLIAYTPGMDVSRTILRRDARLYEVPTGQVSCKAAVNGSGNTMREIHSYFVDCYWDLDKAQTQFDLLKASGDSVTMVTFLCAYLNGSNIARGNTYLGCDANHREAVKYSDEYFVDPQVDAIDWCIEHGKLAFLGITNASGSGFTDSGMRKILASEANMDAAVAEILSAVSQFGFSGVNLGIELAEACNDLRPAYAVFMRKLSDALHGNGLLLMVTAGAYFTEAQEEKSFYDYAAVNEVADYIHVILYDDYNDTGYPWRRTDGAVSNLTRIGRCLRYAVTRMDADKILLGLGTFAVDFDKTAVTAADIAYADAEALQRRYGAAVQWDSSSASGYFDYQDASGHSHRVWLETAGSIQSRAALMRQYGLCGFSSYYIGSDASLLLDEQVKASSYFPEVSSAIDRGLIPNHLRSRYSQAITRQEFCDMIAAFLQAHTGKTLSQILKKEGLTAHTFTDCESETVGGIFAIGIVTGYPDGTFRPNNTISRQEAATMLMRLARFCGMTVPNGESIEFAELASMQAWARDGVAFTSACVDAVNGKRVMGGTGNNRFSPTSHYTREQSAMTMIRLLHALEG